jgi:hypothetical protein
MIMARFASPCGPRRSRPGRTSAHLHYLSTIISIIAASDMGCQVLVSGPEILLGEILLGGHVILIKESAVFSSLFYNTFFAAEKSTPQRQVHR